MSIGSTNLDRTRARGYATDMTPAQCRAARGLLDWTIPDLAAAAEVSRNTVSQFERGNRHPNRHTLRAMREALERHGVVFTNGRDPGVKISTKFGG